MIRKIICPTDFSDAANNAVEYAANIAQMMSAELLLFNVQRLSPVEAVLSLEEGGGITEHSLMVADVLQEMSNEINKTFKISSSYQVDVSVQSLATMFSSLEEDNTIIIMGTNGTDTLYQYFFGSNTYHVIKNTNCPVLVVPEHVSYKTVQKIVFAWDYNTKSNFSFALLKDFMKIFDPKFIFLHVSQHQSEYSQDVFRAFRSEVEEALGRNNNMEFEHVYAEGVSETIDTYMLESEAEILSLTYYNRGLIPDIFHGKVAKELIETVEYPILILHA